MMNDPLASTLSKLKQYDKDGKRQCEVRPSSKMIKKVLEIMNTNGFIGTVEETTTERGGILRIGMLGNINSCGVIKPRFAVKKDNFVKFEKRYLPAKDFGIVIVSTSQGLMTHTQAKEKGIGGKLVSYCY